MKKGFESVFSEIQSDMVSICMEYVEDKADKIFIYASYEDKTFACDFFYQVNGVIYKKHELPKGYDVSTERQFSCLEILTDDMEQLISVCSEYEADVPTEIKIIYDVTTNQLNASYQYNEVYAFTDKSASDIVEEWYQEICQS